MARILAASWLALVLTFLAVPVTSGQESQTPTASTSPTAVAEKEPQEASRDPKEAAGRESNENEAFRHSDAVKAVARITGLSLDQAFWLCTIVNFLVVVAILWLLLKKALPTVFRNRTEAIQRRLEEARKTSEDARRRLTDVEARLSRLDTEIEQMRREADAASVTEEKGAMETAEEERRRIVESAEQEIARAVSAARRELKAYAAELAVDLAEKKIHITETMDHKLLRSFASQIGRDEN